ncbi:MAG: hypothetical protein AB7S50_06945 [Bacteroidales bacterium]
MKDNKVDIEKITGELIRKDAIQQPGADFTKNLMAKILKDPSVQVSYIKQDENKNNILLILLVLVMFIAYLGYYFYKNGLTKITETGAVPGMTYLQTASDFISRLWSEISLSPYILLSFIGIVVLILLDKYIVKYLYTI